MENIKKINNIINKICTYDFINSLTDKHLRNKKDGIQLDDAIYCKFKYAQLNETHESVTSHINYINDTHFTRQNYIKKENNIPILFYEQFFTQIYSFYKDNCINQDNKIAHKLIAVDGTSSLNTKYELVLNMGYFDIINGVPVTITHNGHENRNNEIKCFKEYVTNNLESFKNTIFICDRFYFSYELINFLMKKNIKFIIRIKGDGLNLSKNVNIKKGTKDRDLIYEIRKGVRVVRCKNTIKKTMFTGTSKKAVIEEYKVDIKNDCNLVTNLLDDKEYTQNELLKLYRSRWDIEVFFKFLKYNFKFAHIKDKNIDNCKKLYFCELILTYLSKILQYYYLIDHNKINLTIKKRNTNKIVKCTAKVNQTNFMKGIFTKVLYDFLHGTLNVQNVNKFCKNYIKIIKNEGGRSFPRSSKTPFTKWYIKDYSNLTKCAKIIKAFLDKTISELDKNLKIIANKIIKVSKIQ